MNEIVPGVWHWSRIHPNHGRLVSSYFVAATGLLIDPMVPDEGLDAVAEAAGAEPRRIALSCRHHRRDSAEFAARYDLEVLCNEEGLHEFEDDGDLVVRGFAPPARIDERVTALPVGAISPDETALLVETDESAALVVADGVMRGDDGELRFVSDSLLGDDPQQVKSGLRKAFAEIAGEQEFGALLVAHGEPIVRGGREALAAFAAG
jgi:hypothetical protein